MGIRTFLSSGSPQRVSDPDPARFEIRQLHPLQFGVVALVHYPGCTTFEGRKILVLECTAEQLLLMSRFDPHFADGSPLVARLRPDMVWELAVGIAAQILEHMFGGAGEK